MQKLILVMGDKEESRKAVAQALLAGYNAKGYAELVNVDTPALSERIELLLRKHYVVIFNISKEWELESDIYLNDIINTARKHPFVEIQKINVKDIE